MADCEAWLEEIIREAGGWITFERFMAEALYNPRHGYYSSQVKNVGRQGDFSTSATLTPAFGEAIARWASQRAAELFSGQSFAVIEVGAGNGDLAVSFTAAWNAMGRKPLTYLTVETSPCLRKALFERSSEHGFLVAESVPEALASCEGRALIFSNELVDAFPAKQLIWQADDWQELCLEIRDGKLAEAAIPFTDAVDAEAPAQPRDGLRLFIHPSFHDWLVQKLQTWQRGALLSIDYGAARPAHECRSFQAQGRREKKDIYANAGKQDITCDVNFSDLRRWGEGLGWKSISLESQHTFLASWLPNAEARTESDPALGFIMRPQGAGGAFLALEQQKG